MRFLHTADWQIGMRCLQAGDRAGAVRAARLATIARIVEVANAEEADFMLVAGDQFESRTPAEPELAAVASVLRAAKMPVFVLPGNHDPAGIGGPYLTPAWASLTSSRVVTILEPGAFEVPGGVLLATPCASKYSTADPTAWFAAHATPSGAIRVGLAHGTLQVRALPVTVKGDQRGGFPVPLGAASRGRLDYLALGHWHDYAAFVDGNAVVAYSGTPEQTTFDDRDCGTVSLVTIAAAGATPSVRRIAVGTLQWRVRRYEVSDDASVAHAAADLRAIPKPDCALVRAVFEGLCAPSASEALLALENEMRARFVSFDLRRAYVLRPDTREAWLERLPPGDLRGVANALLDAIERDQQPAVASRALDLLAGFAR